MKKLEYHWTKDLKGQFVDGHERDDVVTYRQETFLPAWAAIKEKTQDWSCHKRDGDYPHLSLQEQKTVVWWHDESTFYANDCHKIRWVHNTETAVPYAKGEGPSQMVADLIFADYRWLRSPDGKEEARVFFKAGKNRERYFTNQDIFEQAQKSVDILEKYYTNGSHVLMFDNATTYLKCADGALSARNMPKGTSKAETNWAWRLIFETQLANKFIWAQSHGQILMGMSGMVWVQSRGSAWYVVHTLNGHFVAQQNAASIIHAIQR